MVFAFGWERRPEGCARRPRSEPYRKGDYLRRLAANENTEQRLRTEIRREQAAWKT